MISTKYLSWYVVIILMSSLFNHAVLAADSCETDKDCGGHLLCVSNKCKYVPSADEAKSDTPKPKIEKVARILQVTEAQSTSGEKGLKILLPISIRGWEDSVLYMDVWDMNAVKNRNTIKLPDPTGKLGKLAYGSNFKARQDENSDMYAHFNAVSTVEIKFTAYSDDGPIEGEILLLRDGQKSTYAFKQPNLSSPATSVTMKIYR